MSHLERIVEIILDSEKIPYEQHYRAIPGKNFKFDFYVKPDILIEINGGNWIHGRHIRAADIEYEYARMNLAVLNGFKMLVYGTDIVVKNPMKIVEDLRKLI